jgi:NADPH2:quinone reductase
MSTMRAIIVDSLALMRLAIHEVPLPTIGSNEVMVQVKATSLNLGEVRHSRTADEGYRPGWDVAGIVVQSSPLGNLSVGTRVVGFVEPGAWAEYVAVPLDSLAVLPDSVSFKQAATLPGAGLTALHAVEHGGTLSGKKVLVTGASGGVGHFAVQLATLNGGTVTGLIRRAEVEPMVRAAGAKFIAMGDDASAASHLGPFDLIIESVGGRTLSTALRLLAPDGTCVSFAASSAVEVAFDARRFFATGGATLYGLLLPHELKRRSASQGLEILVDLVASKQLYPHVSLEDSWTQVSSLARQLLERRASGKIVMYID